MDRALIERMVGAVVLVLLLVVVAPALLDGSRDSDSEGRQSDVDGATRTEIIVLNGPPGTQEAQPAQPVSGSDQPVAQTAQPAARAPKPEPKPEPEPVVRQQPAAQEELRRQPEGYAVQIGSFASKDNADQFAAGLSGEGYAVFVMAARTAAGKVYRVNAGPRATRADAEKLAATISKSGRSVMVIELGSKTDGGSQ